MLFVSERSWKHHYVTLLLPYTYLTYRVADARGLARVRVAPGVGHGAVGAPDGDDLERVGGLFADGQGHKIAQGYGMFLWAGVVLYIATAWRVWVERDAEM